MRSCVIQGFVSEPIPPNAALTIDSSIITWIQKSVTSEDKQKYMKIIEYSLMLSTCYDNICQIASINEASMPSTRQLSTTAI